MRRAALLAMLIPLSCAESPARAAMAPEEAITIDVSNTWSVCVGFCPIFTLTVRSDESIELIVPPQPAGHGPRTRILRWQGRPGDFAHIRETLAPVRPVGAVTVGPPCEGDFCWRRRPYTYILSWRGPGRRARLTTNGDRNIYCRVWRSVADLGVDAGAGRRDDSNRGMPLFSFCDAILGESH